jgi:hypothetical protein
VCALHLRLQLAHVQQLVAVDGQEHHFQADLAQRRMATDEIQLSFPDRARPGQCALARRLKLRQELGRRERLIADLLLGVVGVVVETGWRARPAPGNVLTQPQQMNLGREEVRCQVARRPRRGLGVDRLLPLRRRQAPQHFQRLALAALEFRQQRLQACLGHRISLASTSHLSGGVAFTT